MVPTPKTRAAGFTLVELVIVMAVLATILAVVIPNVKGMQDEANLTKVEGELNTLKDAVVSYWRNNQFKYPPDCATALLVSSPEIINPVLPDPYRTDPATSSYGYVTGNDPNFGDWFFIYSKGPKGDTTAPVWDAANARVTFSGSGRVVSNAPVVRQ